MSEDSPSTIQDLIPTEQRNPATEGIDELSTEGVLSKINEQDMGVAMAIQQAIPSIAVVVDKIVNALKTEGHLFYFGAGTSGRLGVLDASECPPTYGTQPEQVQAYIAGGDYALRHAVEGAEDNYQAGYDEMMSVESKHGDVVVGISASGRAAYVAGVLNAATEKNCFTVFLTNNPQAELISKVNQAIIVPVGPEVIAGSTRMKAGTAQKLVLNMLTTATMIQLGKTYSNWMVDVQPTNNKLKQRATRMVSALAGVSEQEAEDALRVTRFQVKPAVVMLKLRLSHTQAVRHLSFHQNKLRLALAHQPS
jgi:N-acetylmuramic acid 6-phosphate etherase